MIGVLLKCRLYVPSQHIFVLRLLRCFNKAVCSERERERERENKKGNKIWGRGYLHVGASQGLVGHVDQNTLYNH